MVNYKPLKYDSQYEYPVGGQVLGLIVGFTHVVFVPLYFLYALLMAPGLKIQEVRYSAYIAVSFSLATVFVVIAEVEVSDCS